MNPALRKLGGLALSALWAAVAATLGKIMEPFLKWLLFLSMRGLVWLLPPGKAENAIIELYKEFKQSYGEKYDLDGYMENYPQAPLGRVFGRRDADWRRKLAERKDPYFGKPKDDRSSGVRHQGAAAETSDSTESPGSLGKEQASTGASPGTDTAEAGGNNKEREGDQ